MKTYPKISAEISFLKIYAFDKLDGSNIRAEWSRKRGFYKFGTRHRMLGEDDKTFGEAIGLIQDKYSKDISDIMKKARFDKGVFFFEFFGESSEFGWHDEIETHDVVLFDANIAKKGMFPPKEFLKLFGNLDTAALLYTGNPNNIFLEKVRNGTLPGMTFEGVVCKAKHPKKPGVLMFKVKSLDWYTALRGKCAGDESLYKERS
tara:strand:+ start:931 stop:1542 length:612 start_codon:yes stop_codon:yes gene_type:complete